MGVCRVILGTYATPNPFSAPEFLDCSIEPPSENIQVTGAASLGRPPVPPAAALSGQDGVGLPKPKHFLNRDSHNKVSSGMAACSSSATIDGLPLRPP